MSRSVWSQTPDVTVQRGGEESDFEKETATIRTWLAYGCVSIDRLAAELHKWAEWADAPLRSATPDQSTDGN